MASDVNDNRVSEDKDKLVDSKYKKERDRFPSKKHKNRNSQEGKN